MSAPPAAVQNGLFQPPPPQDAVAAAAGGAFVPPLPVQGAQILGLLGAQAGPAAQVGFGPQIGLGAQGQGAAQAGGGAQMPPGQVMGNGMQNALLNANYALNTASWAEQEARAATQACSDLAKAQARAERWAKDLKISQEKEKYSSPSDKKGVHYLQEEFFDLKDL